MLLFEIEDYSTQQIAIELKNSRKSLRIARMNFEFEEQNILQEKIAKLSNELDRRGSEPHYRQPEEDKVEDLA